MQVIPLLLLRQQHTTSTCACAALYRGMDIAKLLNVDYLDFFFSSPVRSTYGQEERYRYVPSSRHPVCLVMESTTSLADGGWGRSEQ